jgi:hypothetical protein
MDFPAHQKAAEIKAGDQLFYKFRRYHVTEATGGYGGVMTRLVGHGDSGDIHVLVASGRKFWTLKKREHHEPLHGLRGRHVPVRRRLALLGVPGHQHLPVLPRDQVGGAAGLRGPAVGVGILTVRAVVGPRIPTHGSAAYSASVPYLFSVGGTSLVHALHTGRRPGLGADWADQALGEGAMVSHLHPSLHGPSESSVGGHRPPIRILIPQGAL